MFSRNHICFLYFKYSLKKHFWYFNKLSLDFLLVHENLTLRDEARWWKSRGTCSTSPTNTTKKTYLHIKWHTPNNNWMLEEVKPPRMARISWYNWVKQEERERRGIRTGLALLRGNWEGEREPTPWKIT